MNNWTTVFLYELTRNIRRRAYMITTFGVPILGLILLGGYLLVQQINDESEQDNSAEIDNPYENQKPIGYVDQTESGYFAFSTDTDNPFAGFLTPYDSTAEGEAAVKNGDIEALYVIEPDYFETGNITLWMEKINFDQFTNNVMEAFLLQSLVADTDPATAVRLRYPLANLTQQRITTDGSEQDSFEENFILVYVFALSLMISTFTASGYLLQSVVDEKENNTIEIILTSVKPFPLLLGKTLAMGLLGFFQILVWGTSAFILAKIASVQVDFLSNLDVKPETLIVALLYFILGFLFTGSVFASIGTLTNNTRDGSQMAGWVVFPTILPLFFTAIFADEPNGTIATILSMLPFTAPLSMVMRVAVTTVPLYQLVVSLLAQSLAAMVGVWIAGRMFRIGSLLRGTPPRFRDIPKLLFES